MKTKEGTTLKVHQGREPNARRSRYTQEEHIQCRGRISHKVYVEKQV